MTFILNALGLSTVKVPVLPPPIISVNPGRAPSTSDIGYPLGQEWIYNFNEYVLVNVAAGVATWLVAGSAVLPATLTNHALVVGRGAAPMSTIPLGTTGQ